MKLRLLTTLLTYTFLFNAPAIATETEEARPSLNYPIINIKNINEEMVNAFMEGEVENVILEFTEGTLLPFSTSLTGNIINILPKEREPIYFSIQETFYLGITSENFYFSSDLVNWEETLNFFTGDIGLQLEPTPQGPILKLSGELNRAS